jgi:hypothetical protein
MAGAPPWWNSGYSKPLNYIPLTVSLLALLVLLLHLAAYVLPGELAWGLWPYTTLPPLAGGALAVAVASLALPEVNRAVRRLLGLLWEMLPGKERRHLWFAFLALASLPVFWAARLGHLCWGDSFLLAKGVANPEVRLTYNWQAPLTVFLHAKLWAVGGWPDAATAYALTSTLCGGLFVYVLLLTARVLGRNGPERAVTFGLVLSAGAAQLFFGYVENYTIMSLGVLLYLYLGLRCLRGEIGFTWPTVALALTNAFHPSTIVLIPSLLYLFWRRAKGEMGIGAFARLTLPFVIVALGVLLLLQSGGHGLDALTGVDAPGGMDRRWLVPLWRAETRWEHYTMFSQGHLRDIVNEQLLIAPFGLPLILAIIPLYIKLKGQCESRTDIGDEILSFLVVATGFYLLFTWMWNPDYGGQRDWDLFASVAWPLMLLSSYLLTRLADGREDLAACGLILSAASLLFTAAWVYTNTQPYLALNGLPLPFCPVP